MFTIFFMVDMATCELSNAKNTISFFLIGLFSGIRALISSTSFKSLASSVPIHQSFLSQFFFILALVSFEQSKYVQAPFFNPLTNSNFVFNLVCLLSFESSAVNHNPASLADPSCVARLQRMPAIEAAMPRVPVVM